GLPEDQPFRANTQSQSDADLTPLLPPAGVAQCGITAPADQLLQPMQPGEMAGSLSGRKWDVVELGGDLAGVIVNGEASHGLDERAPLQEGAGDRVEGMAQGRGGAHSGDPNGGECHGASRYAE